jgi:2-C-methyl-D-erythritol 4-phosphate cytidylyltransferase
MLTPDHRLREAGGSGRACAILVAAGQSRRMGGLAKTLHPLADRPAIAYSLDALQNAESIEEIVIVCNDETRAAVKTIVAEGAWPKIAGLALGGARRQDSVAAGLAGLDLACDVVVIHDGARPFAPSGLFDACVAAARMHGAAIAAAPVVDTLKRVEDDEVRATLDRSGLWAAQTPQAFQIGLLREAFTLAERAGFDVTDEAMLMEKMRQPVHIVENTRFNLKLTHAADLAIAEAYARYLKEQR